MSIPYTEWRYILPPRTDVKVPIKSPVVGAWARMGDAVAQLKLNGSRNLIVIDPSDNIQFWNRHREQQRNYVISEKLIRQIRDLAYPHGYWNIFDSELLHFKTPEVKHSVYLFDALVWKSEYLIGADYNERFGLVQPLIKDFYPLDNPHIVDRMFIAENIQGSSVTERLAAWQAAWGSVAKINAVEGLVLKRTGPVSRLSEAGGREYNNGSFMCRIRKPFKNSQF